jgi:hypothetical protein
MLSSSSSSGVRALPCRKTGRDGMVVSHNQRDGVIEGLSLSWRDPPTLRR